MFPLIGAVVGGVVAAVAGSDDSSDANAAAARSAARAQARAAEASRDAAIAQSDAQVQIARTQAATMQLGIMQSSQNAQFQTLAWLTDRLDTNDTKLQIAVENAKLQMQQQSDHHVEAMQGLKNDARELEIREIEAARAKEAS